MQNFLSSFQCDVVGGTLQKQGLWVVSGLGLGSTRPRCRDRPTLLLGDVPEHRDACTQLQNFYQVHWGPQIFPGSCLLLSCTVEQLLREVRCIINNEHGSSSTGNRLASISAAATDCTELHTLMCNSRWCCIFTTTPGFSSCTIPSFCHGGQLLWRGSRKALFRDK